MKQKKMNILSSIGTILSGVVFGMTIPCISIQLFAGENKEAIKQEKSILSSRPAGAVQTTLSGGASTFGQQLNLRTFQSERNLLFINKNLKQRDLNLQTKFQKELLESRPEKKLEIEEKLANLSLRSKILKDRTSTKLFKLEKNYALTRNGIILIGGLLTADGIAKVISPETADGLFALDDVAGVIKDKTVTVTEKIFGLEKTPATVDLAEESTKIK